MNLEQFRADGNRPHAADSGVAPIVYKVPNLAICRDNQPPGTAGCIVGKLGSTDRYLLSCAHVLAWNALTLGGKGDAIRWPAVGGNAASIGELDQWAPAVDGDGTLMDIDAACAKLDPAKADALAPFVTTPEATGTILPEDEVFFRGARSGHRTGIVKETDFTWDVHYSGVQHADVPLTFKHLVRCETNDGEPFSAEGDSGSAVFRMRQGKPVLVGVLMGCSSSSMVFCEIDRVFQRFGLEIYKKVTGMTPPANPAPAVPPPAPPPLAENAAPSGLAIDNLTPELIRPVFEAGHRITDNIALYLPKVKAALIEKSLTDAAMVSMAIATVRVESAAFEPIDEGAWSGNSSTMDPENLFDAYDRKNGNLGRPDGKTFKGRGFVQLTGRGNYETYGNMIGVDLVSDPKMANEPTNAARLLTAFLSDHETRIRNALRNDDLAAARKAVNGGSHGLDKFETAYTSLMAALVP